MANKIYVLQEAATTFSTTGSVTFTPTSLANGAGRISAQWDRGASARPAMFTARMRCKFATAPTAGNVVEAYLAAGNGVFVDGNLGVSDAAVSSSDKRRNLRWLMNLAADSTSSSEIFVATRRVWIPDRYVSILWWNAVGVALSSTATDHEFVLTPISDEIQ